MPICIIYYAAEEFWQSWKIGYQETVPARHCWWSKRNHKNYYNGWKSAAQHMQTCQYLYTDLYLTLRYAGFYYHNLSANFLLSSSVSSHCLASCRPVQKPAKRKQTLISGGWIRDSWPKSLCLAQYFCFALWVILCTCEQWAKQS